MKNAALNTYVWVLRRLFLLPGPLLNLFARTCLLVLGPALKKRNYWKRIEEVLKRVAVKDHPYIKLIHNIANCNDNYWRAFAVSFILHRLTLGVSKTMSDVGRERHLEKEGVWLPSLVVISVTSDCNLKCEKCYAEGRFEPRELEFEVIDRIITEGEASGTFMYDIVGGEPMMRASELYELFGKHPKSCFVVITNGTLIDEHAAKMFAKLGNVLVCLSIDGFEATNDARRGDGVYQKVVGAMEFLAKERVAFSTLVTVSRQNFDEVISDALAELVTGHGALGLSFNKYIPADRKPDPEMELSTNQVAMLRIWKDHLRDNFPLYVRVGEVAEDEVAACDAARRHVHITPSGDVEPCLFCPVSVDNIHDVSLKGAFNSLFFNRIRAYNGTCEAEIKPCMMFRDPSVGELVQSLAKGK